MEAIKIEAWKSKVVELLIEMRNNGKSLSDIERIAGGNKTSISDAINRNFGKVGENMWKIWKSKLNIYEEWAIYPTRNYLLLKEKLDNALRMKRLVGISTYTGAGKTETCRWFARNNKRVYYVMCDGEMTVRDFLVAVQDAMSLSVNGGNSMRCRAIADKLKKEGGMLIVDEFSAVKRNLYHTIGTIVKDVEYYASVALVGTEYLKSDFEHLAKSGKRGMGEIERRFSKNWVQLPEFSIDDVAMIAQNNGVTDAKQIKHLYSNVRNFGELRDLITQISV